MKDSAGVRKLNMEKVRQILRDGAAYTKQQIAQETGLSVATCNTLLNELEFSHEVTGEKRRLQEVGRSTVVYRISEEHECFLCVRLDLEDGKRKLILDVLSVLGRVLEESVVWPERLDAAEAECVVSECLKRHPNVSRIVVGVCGTAWQGVVRHCDIPELNEAPLPERFRKRFGLPVWMENDMHLRAYGYYKTRGSRNDVVTLAYFPENILPGTASVHAGTVIRGCQEFAGMVGFLSEGANRSRLPELMDKRTALPHLIRTAVSIAVMINPSHIVFTGGLVDEEILKKVHDGCANMVPEEYIPEFVYEPDPGAFYLDGMYHRALDLSSPENGRRQENGRVL